MKTLQGYNSVNDWKLEKRVHDKVSKKNKKGTLFRSLFNHAELVRMIVYERWISLL